ncbi:hypothetical protein BJ508DRAFT_331110 [Ascobolus immersus RN42]|uniref:Uncharacterized protein n=1 Tax=Ascobolus immersus RN42 TaxID=1160509 RepID=A0A3N4HV82_ASCIM|nr:hypothetical protein BJ508DRAFT_331110 [Ascobolus immersus RN42]
MPHATMKETIGLSASSIPDSEVLPFERCTTEQSRFLSAIRGELYHSLTLERCPTDYLKLYYSALIHQNWKDSLFGSRVQEIFSSSNGGQYVFCLMDDKETIYSFERGLQECSVYAPNRKNLPGQLLIVTKFTLDKATGKWPSRWSVLCVSTVDDERPFENSETWYAQIDNSKLPEYADSGSSQKLLMSTLGGSIGQPDSKGNRTICVRISHPEKI